MATFPSITPTYGQQKNSAPNVRTVKFQDGYEHRILFGLAAHQNPKTFLDARAEDGASFDFTPPGEASSSKFVCQSWTKSIPYLNRATINTTFRQVFEP